MDTLTVLQRIVPELKDVLERRYTLLRAVRTFGPVGRRTLTSELNISERTVRSELDILRAQGLIETGSSGVRLSREGEIVLSRLDEMARKLYDLAAVEQAMAAAFKLQRVIIVPGDSDADPGVKRDMAQVTAAYLRSILRDGDILAVTGGTTLAQVAESFPGRALTAGSQSFPPGVDLGRTLKSKPTPLRSA